MSAAVVATPLYVPVALAVAPLLVPVVAGLAIGALVKAFGAVDDGGDALAAEREAAAAEAARRRAVIVGHLRDEFGRAISGLRAQAASARLTPKGREVLAGELTRLAAAGDDVVDRFATDGDAAGCRRWRDRLEAFQQQLAWQEVIRRDLERRQLAARQRLAAVLEGLAGSDRIAGRRAVSGGAPGDAEADAVLEEARAVLAAPPVLGDEAVEAAVERVERLLAEIRAVAIRRQAAVARADAAAAARMAESQRLAIEITEAADRLRQEFPEVLDSGLTVLISEAGAVLDANAPAELTTGRDVEPGRLRAIRDQVRLVVQGAVERRFLTGFFQDRLRAAGSVVDPDSPLGVRLAAALAVPVLGREEFDRLWAEVTAATQDRLDQERRLAVEERVRAVLARLDYVTTPGITGAVAISPPVQDPARPAGSATAGSGRAARPAAGSPGDRLRAGQPVLLATRHADLRLLLRLGEGERLNVRLIRVVERESSPAAVSAHEQARDRELVREWCGHLDRVLEELQAAGICFIQNLRLEDGIDRFTIAQLEQQGLTPGVTRPRAKAVVRQRTRGEN